MRVISPGLGHSARSANLALRYAPLSIALAVLCQAFLGCGSDSASPLAGGGSGGMSTTDKGAVVGGVCSPTKACRSGLICAGGLCAPGGSTALGGKCVISGECDGGQCVQGTCAATGEGDIGGSCKTDVDCQSGLRCQVVGLFAQCQLEGVGDLGTGCEANADCFAGLFCIDETCKRPTIGAPLGGTTFDGVRCDALESAGSRAYFEVPGAAGADEGDFFRLPFPNDVRIDSDGKLDLSGFPSPGRGALGFDPVARYAESIEAERGGWGSDPSVIFRFSSELDSASLEGDEAIHFVDVTPGVAENGDEEPVTWYYSRERSPYVCKSWLSVRRPLGKPLLPEHVYAVYVTDRVRDANGGQVAPSENLTALLGVATPSDGKLGAAHERYAPLREYLAARDVDPTTLVTASVISVGAVRDPMARLAAAVAALDPPQAHDWVKCDAGVQSPCPDRKAADGRGCQAPSSEFDEYQALVDLPIFQRGTPPYLLAADRGDIDFDGPVRVEPVCLSLTIPKQVMPHSGWPLVVFAHGTGGNYRDHVRPEVAGALAAATLPDGSEVGLAVLGIDQVEHSTRRGSSDQDPNNLFFNIANPYAVRGNAMQGAADQLGLARLAATLDVTVGSTSFRTNSDKIFFFGHSQGATEGSLMLPYSDVYKAAVLSGNGGSLRESLLAKKNPVDVSAALPFVLSDPTLKDPQAARAHPVLSILQHWVDPADPLNFARGLVLSPFGTHAARHVFQPYGLHDTYSPPSSMQAFLLAGGFPLVENSGFPPDPIGDLSAVAAPLSGNIDGVTFGAREYDPGAAGDGHFVAFLVPQANADVVRFFARAAHGETPAIGE
jgi:predicted esterase